MGTEGPCSRAAPSPAELQLGQLWLKLCFRGCPCAGNGLGEEGQGSAASEGTAGMSLSCRVSCGGSGTDVPLCLLLGITSFLSTTGSC